MKKVTMRKMGMPACEDISRLVSESSDRSLSVTERWKVRLHLAMCRHCTRFERQLRLLRDAIEKDKRGD